MDILLVNEIYMSKKKLMIYILVVSKIFKVFSDTNIKKNYNFFFK